MSGDLDGDRDRLSALWRRQFPKGPPVAHELRAAYSDRWVRFHSLPGSKRYPETGDEYAVVLHRCNTVRAGTPAGATRDAPQGTRRMTLAYDDDREVADVIAASPEERDRLRESHRDWLPRHPSGL
ncbi:DUF3885 domain-containing protein [Streptomyces hokutonensis]|uniref:DUF3885 domain-containing protein n=1 Tax=Streptomyces hokutonensis TaxID=1306990 RepID=UPI000363E80C|nr:hypothetical protein [Streptomyces hokutonensis]